MINNDLVNSPIERFRKDIEHLLAVSNYANECKTLAWILKQKKSTSDKAIVNLCNRIIDSQADQTVYNLLHVNLITAMEVYLKDKIFDEIKLKPKIIEVFLRKYSFNKKIDVEDLLLGPYSFAERVLDEVVFHNLKKVDKIYRILFGINIAKFVDFKKLNSYIKIRHHIIHNNSMLNNGKITINPACITHTCNFLIHFIESIDYFIKHNRKRKRSPDLIRKFSKGIVVSDEYVKASYAAHMSGVCPIMNYNKV